MRKSISWLAVLVVCGFAFTPGQAGAQQNGDFAFTPGQAGAQQNGDDDLFLSETLVRGQLGDVPPPSPTIPWPFGRPRLDQGGFYIAGEFMYWKQTNPLKSEALAFRGLEDFDNSIHTALGLPVINGNWIGSKVDALDVQQVTGPNNYTPGFNFTVGYRWESGVALEIRWIHLFDNKQSATAGLLPPTQTGTNLQETFITSPVYNFPPAYVGPGNVTGVGNPLAIIGIWDAASLETILFTQRFDQVDATFRVPIQESDCWRTYGLVGLRGVTMYENFTWRTVNMEANGSVLPQDTATYTNTVSNVLYGVHAGIGNEWELGDTPLGDFSLSLDLDGALLLDIVKGRPKYELGDRSTATGRPRNFLNFVPEGDGQIMLWWYPYEGVVVRLGYEAMGFVNTISSPRPVDFNFGTITPAYESTFRLFDGINFGIGFIF